MHNRAGGDAALVDLTANLPHDLLLVGRVEVVGRLIEQKRLCLLHERPRENHFLVLSARKLIGIAQRVSGKPQPLEHLADNNMVCLRRRALHERMAPDEYRIVDRQAVRMAVLGDERDLLRPRTPLDLAHGHAVEKNPPRVRLSKSHQARQERRLAAPVHPENRRERPRRKLDRHVAQDRGSRPIGKAEPTGCKHQRLTPRNNR